MTMGTTIPTTGPPSELGRFAYLKDPASIYRESFRAIEREVDLGRLPEPLRPIAIRLVHACGMPAIVADLVGSEGLVDRAREALHRGASILVDARMIEVGIIVRSLPPGVRTCCMLDDPRTALLAERLATTRSAAAVELWRERLDGALVAIGNAPTALFHLLERLAEWPERPAAILGFPVGFVGAAESKEALLAHHRGIPFLTLRGRLGGSAMAAAAVNALLAEPT